jgi:hypothetical protein
VQNTGSSRRVVAMMVVAVQPGGHGQQRAVEPFNLAVGGRSVRPGAMPTVPSKGITQRCKLPAHQSKSAGFWAPFAKHQG